MSDVFLTYSSSDHIQARRLAAVLERRGLSVFWDRNIPAGVDFASFIENELHSANCIIVFWSKESTRTQWVLDEAEFAKKKGILVMVLTGLAETPRGFRTLQSVELMDWQGEAKHVGLDRILNAVSQHIQPQVAIDGRGSDGQRGETGESGRGGPGTRKGGPGARKAGPGARKGGPKGKGGHRKGPSGGLSRPKRRFDVFLSYRRADSAYATGQLSEYLAKRFGKDRIFKDAESIKLGTDYRKAIDEAIADCELMVAVIGTRWMGIRDDGKARIDKEDDMVRIEIETAIRRAVPIVPVLIENVVIPPEERLPNSIQTLPYMNGRVIGPSPEFKPQVKRLIDDLEELLQPNSKKTSPKKEANTKRKSKQKSNADKKKKKSPKKKIPRKRKKSKGK